MNDSQPPHRSKEKIIIGISLIIVGIMAFMAQPAFNIALGGGLKEAPVSHIQGVIGGALVLTMGVVFIYNELKKR